MKNNYADGAADWVCYEQRNPCISQYPQYEVPEKKFTSTRLFKKRVLKNIKSFGWELYDAERRTTTTEKVDGYRISYNGREIDGILPVTSTRSETTNMWYFYRYKSWFKNLPMIKPVEKVFDVISVVRKLLGGVLCAVLPLLIVVAIALMSFMGEYVMYAGTAAGICVGVYAVLIMAENFLALLARLILRRRKQ